jgi:hypothetical protein
VTANELLPAYRYRLATRSRYGRYYTLGRPAGSHDVQAPSQTVREPAAAR